MRYRFLFFYLSFIIFIACKEENNKREYTKWDTYRGTKDANQYSSLTQVDTSNVHQLKVAWQYNTGDALSSSTIECNPIIIDSVMYITSPLLKVIALNAASGKEIWRFNPFIMKKVPV